MISELKKNKGKKGIVAKKFGGGGVGRAEGANPFSIQQERDPFCIIFNNSESNKKGESSFIAI